MASNCLTCATNDYCPEHNPKPRTQPYPAPEHRPRPHLRPLGNGIWQCADSLVDRHRRAGFGSDAVHAWNAWCASWGTHLSTKL